MNNRRSKFTPHTFAVFRHVWTLNEQERDMLDRSFMLKTTGAHLHSLIDCSHDWKDTIINQDVKYEIVYQECCYDMLDRNLVAKPLLLSFRYNEYNHLAFMLVKQPYSNANLSFYKDL